MPEVHGTFGRNNSRTLQLDLPAGVNKPGLLEELGIGKKILTGLPGAGGLIPPRPDGSRVVQPRAAN